MPNPPLHLPRSIAFSGITSGGSASAEGGGGFTIPLRGKNVIARIDGDPDGVFSIAGLQLLALVHEPDAPHSGLSWETVETVAGPGPIQIPPGIAPGALAVTVNFSVGLSQTKTSYAASVSIVAAGTSGPVLYSIPVTSTVILIPPGIAGTITWSLDLFNPASLPSIEWVELLTVTVNTINPAPPGAFPSYTQVASAYLTQVTNDLTNVYATYKISDGPGIPYNEPLVLLIYAGLFKVSFPLQGFNAMQTSGPSPVILTQSQPGVEVDFELFGFEIK